MHRSFNGTLYRRCQEEITVFLKMPFAKTINKLIMEHAGPPADADVHGRDGTEDHAMIVKDVQGLAHQYCGEGVPVQLKV